MSTLTVKNTFLRLDHTTSTTDTSLDTTMCNSQPCPPVTEVASLAQCCHRSTRQSSCHPGNMQLSKPTINNGKCWQSSDSFTAIQNRSHVRNVVGKCRHMSHSQCPTASQSCPMIQTPKTWMRDALQLTSPDITQEFVHTTTQQRYEQLT